MLAVMPATVLRHEAWAKPTAQPPPARGAAASTRGQSALRPSTARPGVAVTRASASPARPPLSTVSTAPPWTCRVQATPGSPSTRATSPAPAPEAGSSPCSPNAGPSRVVTTWTTPGSADSAAKVPHGQGSRSAIENGSIRS